MNFDQINFNSVAVLPSNCDRKKGAIEGDCVQDCVYRPNQQDNDISTGPDVILMTPKRLGTDHHHPPPGVTYNKRLD